MMIKSVRALKPYHWFAIDLLAIAIVGGFLISICPIMLGASQPSSLISPDSWKLIAFLGWFVVGSGAVVLLACQLDAMGLLESRPISQPTTSSEQPQVVERRVPDRVLAAQSPTMEYGDLTEDTEHATEEAEPVLVSSGA
jgi:hypothetical protein